MKLRRLPVLLFPLGAIVLELLPYGAVCNFANPDGEPWRRHFSYFDPTPYGYANFGPLITAVLTCILLLLTAIYFFLGSKGVRTSVMIISAVATATSLMPIMFGIDYITIIGVMITLLLAVTFGYCLIKKEI